jgi:hypothetical protein
MHKHVGKNWRKHSNSTNSYSETLEKKENKKIRNYRNVEFTQTLKEKL